MINYKDTIMQSILIEICLPIAFEIRKWENFGYQSLISLNIWYCYCLFKFHMTNGLPAYHPLKDVSLSELHVLVAMPADFLWEFVIIIIDIQMFILVIGIGSSCFHATLLYEMQVRFCWLMNILPVNWTSCHLSFQLLLLPFHFITFFFIKSFLWIYVLFSISRK